jgi:hypothetical protein
MRRVRRAWVAVPVLGAVALLLDPESGRPRAAWSSVPGTGAGRVMYAQDAP